MRHQTLYCYTNCHFDVLLSTHSITHFWKRHTMNTQSLPEIQTFYWSERHRSVLVFDLKRYHMYPCHQHRYQTFNAMIQGQWSIKLKTQQCKIKKTTRSRKSSFKLGRTSLSSRYKILCKRRFSRSLVHKKELTLIRPLVFKLEYLFWQEKQDTSFAFQWNLWRVASDNNFVIKS